MNIRQTILASAIALISIVAAGSASAATYFVSGKADPYLAGAGPGSSITWDTGDVDNYGTESPVSIAVTGGSNIKITYLNGTASHGPCCVLAGPTGDGSFANTNNFTANGYTNFVNHYASALPFDSLVGVFSGIGNVFEIGTGGTFYVPVGTTTLYLGTVDSYQWNNNLGGFNVEITAVPEPATWAMLMLGFGAIGWTLRGRRKDVAATA